jgi:hypothetical protein
VLWCSSLPLATLPASTNRPCLHLAEADVRALQGSAGFDPQETYAAHSNSCRQRPDTASGKCRIVEDEIRFWNGSKIFLCHCKDEKNKFKYLGSEIHVLLVDELTHFTGTIYQFLRTRVRMVGIDVPEEHRGKFPRILCASNPGNVGHLWVKEAFVAHCEAGKIRQMPASEGGMRRQFIPARLDDNQIGVEADPTYEERLEGIGSAAQVKAYRWGDWNVIEGAFFDCFSYEKRPPHVSEGSRDQ